MPFLPIIPQSLSEPVKSLWVSGSPKSSTVGRETPSHPYRLQNKWVLSLSECVIREESVILEEGRDLFYVRECGAVHCCPWIICIFPFQVPFSATMSPVRLHSSNPNLCADIEFQTPPSHLTDPLESSTDYTKLQEEFCLIAQKGNNKSNMPFRKALFSDKRLPFTLFYLCLGGLYTGWSSIYRTQLNMMSASWESTHHRFTVIDWIKKVSGREGKKEER